MLVIRVQDSEGHGPYNYGPDSWKNSMQQAHGDFWDSEHQPLPDFNSCTSDHVEYYEEVARFCFMNYVQFGRWFTDDYIPYIKKDYFVVVFDVKTGHAVSDRIANCQDDFMCCSVQKAVRFLSHNLETESVVRSEERVVRAEFEAFLKYQGVSAAGYLQEDLSKAVGKDGMRNIRVLFLLNTAELVDQQHEAKAQAQPKAQTKHIFSENSDVTEAQMREYLAALRLYVRRPAEFFAKADNQLKGMCGICAAIRSYMNDDLVSYTIWREMLICSSEEISKICCAFEDIRNKNGGRTPQRLKMAKELYTALRKYYPA